MCQQVWKIAVATGLEKVSFHANPKEVQCQRILNYRTFALISHAKRLYSKSFKLGFSSMRSEFSNVQVSFRKGRETRFHIANIHWIRESKEIPQKLLLHWLEKAWKPLTVWITTNCGKFLKGWEYQITMSASWETCMLVKKQQLEPYMEQQTGSKLGKE